jgi:hypothetical protein
MLVFMLIFVNHANIGNIRDTIDYFELEYDYCIDLAGNLTASIFHSYPFLFAMSSN